MAGLWQTSCRHHSPARHRGPGDAGSRALGQGPGLQQLLLNRRRLRRGKSQHPLRTYRLTSEHAELALQGKALPAADDSCISVSSRTQMSFQKALATADTHSRLAVPSREVLSGVLRLAAVIKHLESWAQQGLRACSHQGPRVAFCPDE